MEEEEEGLLITTVFVYVTPEDIGEISHSLYAIEISKPSLIPGHDPDDQQPIKPLEFSLLLEFSASKYPRGMSCAKLGDRLYFFGGRLNPNRDEFPNLDHFPRSVYAFNPSTGELDDAGVPPMNAGKNWPISFVADDNLYVLGSRINTKEESSSSSSSSSPTYFEVFERGVWIPLEPPPFVASWDACSTVVGRKVLVLGRYAEFFIFAFDLGTRNWARIACNCPYDVDELPLWTPASHINEEGGKKNAAAALYGVRSDGKPCKLYISEGQTEVHKLLTCENWNQISLVQDDAGLGRRRVEEVDPFFSEEYHSTLSMSLCYLGDGCFCYLAMACPFYTDESEGIQFIQTVLFKDITLHGDDHDEAQPSSSATQVFKAECIHSAREINPSLSNILEIKNSFAFSLTRKQINRLIGRAPEGELVL